MKRAVLIIAFLALAACGGQGVGSPDREKNEAFVPVGIFVDYTTEIWMRDRLAETAACAGYETPDFNALTVVMMPPTFPCNAYANGCNGEFVPPSTIKLGTLSLWRHEVIHWLLAINTGDSDPGHKSPIFAKCQ